MGLDEESDDKEIARTLAAIRRQRDFDDLQDEIAGRNNGRQARFLNAGQSSEQAKANRRRRQTQADTDMFYLALIESHSFGGYIADEIFDHKSDWQIFDIVMQIETKTGMGFEDYAARILGADAAQRLDGESDADYNRRILKALTDEMLEADGRIKAQYAGESLADIIRGDAAYRRIMQDLSRINRDGPSREAGALVTAYKKAGYATAELAGETVRHDAYKGSLREGQDEDADSALRGDALRGESDSFFDSGATIDDAAEAGKTQFNASAAEQQTTGNAQSTELAPNPKS